MIEKIDTNKTDTNSPSLQDQRSKYSELIRRLFVVVAVTKYVSGVVFGSWALSVLPEIVTGNAVHSRFCHGPVLVV